MTRRIVLKLSGEALAPSVGDETIDAAVVDFLAREIAAAMSTNDLELAVVVGGGNVTAAAQALAPSLATAAVSTTATTSPDTTGARCRHQCSSLATLGAVLPARRTAPFADNRSRPVCFCCRWQRLG